MIVPVLEVVKDSLYRVYVDGYFFAVVVPLFCPDVHGLTWRCVDIRTGEIFVGSTRHEAVDLYFKSNFKESICDE